MAAFTSPSLDGVLLGMGNPLLDISANVGDDMLTKYDLKAGNAILAEDKHKPLYEELVKNYPVEYIAGGATQNSIRVCQWMLQQPNATAMAGCIGDDAFGKQLSAAATKDGVKGVYMVTPTVATGTCAVLVTGGERSLVANLAAANEYKHEHTLTAELQAAIEKAKVYYIAGFFSDRVPGEH